MKLLLRSLVFIGLLLPLGASATTYFVTPAGSGTTCTAAAPCSLTTAAGKTNPGDIVQLAPGTYSGTFSITRSGSAAGGKITYRGHDGTGCPTTPLADKNSRGVRPAPTAVVTGGFSISASFIRIECVKAIANPIAFTNGTRSDIDLLDSYMDASTNPGHGKIFGAEGCDSSDETCFASNIFAARNYAFEPSLSFYLRCNNCTIQDNESERPINAGDGDHVQFFGNNLTFQGNYFHGSVFADAVNAHTDCFQSWNIGQLGEVARNITITRNTCMNIDECVLVRNLGSTSSHQNFTITNNLCAFSRIGGNIQGDGELENVGGTNNVLHNTYIQMTQGFDNGTVANFKNNLLANGAQLVVECNGACASVSQSNNLNLGSNLSSFVSAATSDFHLSSSASTAINRGATGLGITIDHDGNPRDSLPDIGAFEFGSANTPQSLTNVQVTVR
ncbi:MAG TPA: choice-of-anchor Q domain-containing protein [Terriglobales bacterium]|nr:choice-of-anchor Q domain-containing protein [Terriglobales bacterium]